MVTLCLDFQIAGNDITKELLHEIFDFIIKLIDIDPGSNVTGTFQELSVVDTYFDIIQKNIDLDLRYL